MNLMDNYMDAFDRFAADAMRYYAMRDVTPEEAVRIAQDYHGTDVVVAPEQNLFFAPKTRGLIKCHMNKR